MCIHVYVYTCFQQLPSHVNPNTISECHYLGSQPCPIPPKDRCNYPRKIFHSAPFHTKKIANQETHSYALRIPRNKSSAESTTAIFFHPAPGGRIASILDGHLFGQCCGGR